MRTRRPRQHRIETLETRDLLSVNDCIPCLDEGLQGSSGTAEVASAEVSEDTTQFEIASTSAGPQTIFGQARVLELEGSQRVVGDLRSRSIHPFYFEVTEETDVFIENLDGSADFGIFNLQNESIAQEVAGEIDVSLDAGEYLLYVYDFASSSTSFDLEITVPGAPQFIEQFPDVPYLGSNFDWNLNAINAPEVWAQGFTGEGTIVAVLDTGVDYTHPDLDDNIFVNTGEIAGDGIDNDGNGYIDDVRGFDFANFDNDPIDVNGHGTHVAGSIAAERNGFGTTGVAYDATILPVQVLGADGSGSSNAIAAGIRYAVDVGADIINLSLGGGATRSVVNALQYALANDVLVVAASGNDDASRPGAPAIFSSVLSNTISVGAYTSSATRSSFSNQVGTSGAVQIDAPGSRIASTTPGGGYRFQSGTSMATPHVAGVAALAFSANPDVGGVDVRSFLVDGANQSIRDSDSIGGVNAARTVALAYQFDTFSEFESAEGTSAFFATSAVGNQFAFSVTVDGELAFAASFESEGDASEDRFAAEDTNDRTEPELLVSQREATVIDVVFADAEPLVFDSLLNSDAVSHSDSLSQTDELGIRDAEV